MADTTIDSIVAQAIAAAEAASAARDSGGGKKGTPMSEKTKARLQADLAKAKATAVQATKVYQNTPSYAANYAEVKQRNDSAINAINNIQGLLKAGVEPATEKPTTAAPTAPAGITFTPAQMASYQYAQTLQSTLASEYDDLQTKINIYSRGAANPGDKAALEKAGNDYKSTFAALQAAYEKSGIVQGNVQIDPKTGALAGGSVYIDPTKPQEGLKTVSNTGSVTPALITTTGALESQQQQQAQAIPVTPSRAGGAGGGGASGKAGGGTTDTTTITTGGPAPATASKGVLSSGADTRQDTLERQQWANSYGAIGAMALATPWMNDILSQAIAGNWSAQKFTDSVQAYNNGKNWQSIGQSIRDSELAYYGNKQAWAQQYNDKLQILQNSALAQGLDPSVFGAALDLSNPNAIDAAFKDANNPINQYFTQYYNNTPDQTVIDRYVANHSSIKAIANNGVTTVGGTLAANAAALRSYAAQYGVSPMYLGANATWTNAAGSVNNPGSDYFTNAADAIAKGYTTVESEQALYRAQAANMYKPFADQINNGYSVSQLASPYTSAVSNLLEVSPDSVKLGDTTGLGSLVTKALQGDGTNPTTLDQFTSQVKARPEWLNTTNARNSLMDTATSLLRNFGLVVG